jgi:hypothetical protein
MDDLVSRKEPFGREGRYKCPGEIEQEMAGEKDTEACRGRKLVLKYYL